MSLKVNLSRPVFTLYAGLTAGGYDLANSGPENPARLVIASIKSHRWDADAVRYFATARLCRAGVNPYWPRAAMLLDATFFLNDDPIGGYADATRVLRDIAEFPTRASEKGEDTLRWIGRYPSMYRRIEADPAFSDLWLQFQLSVGSQVQERFADAGREALELLRSGLGVKEKDLPAVVVIPNPLQAVQIADFVRKDGDVFAVIAAPRPSSLIHELLHCVFEKAIAEEHDVIVSHRGLFTPAVVDAMLKMQYAWGVDDQSWLRVFEESLVRAASIWVGHRREPDEAARLAEVDATSGFVYVPELLRCFRKNWTGCENAGNFIVSCLGDLER